MHPWEPCGLCTERQRKAVVRDAGPRARHRSAPFSPDLGCLISLGLHFLFLFNRENRSACAL